MFNPIFENKAHHFTIFMKSLFIDGILFSVIVIISFYILLDFLSNISSNLNWLWSTLFFLGYILGIFSIINAIDSYYCYYPNSPLFYLSFISFILLISFITGLGIYLFNETYNLIIKILIASFTILFVAILSMIFNYLKFYDYYEYLYFIIPAVIFSIIFEFKEFRYIRN